MSACVDEAQLLRYWAVGFLSLYGYADLFEESLSRMAVSEYEDLPSSTAFSSAESTDFGIFRCCFCGSGWRGFRQLGDGKIAAEFHGKPVYSRMCFPNEQVPIGCLGMRCW